MVPDPAPTETARLSSSETTQSTPLSASPDSAESSLIVSLGAAVAAAVIKMVVGTMSSSNASPSDHDVSVVNNVLAAVSTTAEMSMRLVASSNEFAASPSEFSTAMFNLTDPGLIAVILGSQCSDDASVGCMASLLTSVNQSKRTRRRL
jgi:hypothetical protein